MLSAINSVDYTIFHAVNQYASHVKPLDSLMVFFADYAQYVLIVLLGLFLLINKNGSRVVAFQALCACATGVIINKVISLFAYRDRPFISHHVNQLIDHAANSSFPSDHATSALVITFTIWLHFKRSGRMWVFMGALIAFSRVWVGVHYPFDVLTGAILGCVLALFIHYVIFNTKIMRAITNLSIFRKSAYDEQSQYY
ncbi:MAG: undecaprenyl-diphosphatase [Priestia megaterium]